MQALDKIIYSDNWITILLVVLLVCVFLLKGINTNKLKASTFALFNKSYVIDEVEDRSSFFKGFNLLLFVFLTINLSLLLYVFLIFFSSNSEKGILFFIKIFSITGVYFIVKWFLEHLISVLFLIKSETRFFVISKSRYLYAITFMFYVAIILYTYTNLNAMFLSYFVGSLFLIRFVIHVIYNKNLILSKLFYFILYLCAFEIAPLFVLYKLMF